MRAFSLAAGPRIGDHVRGERLRGSILYLRCDSSAWAQHVHMLKPSLLERLHKTPGGEGVADLRCNVGPLDEVAGWRRRRRRPRSKRRPRRSSRRRTSRARSTRSRTPNCARTWRASGAPSSAGKQSFAQEKACAQRRW